MARAYDRRLGNPPSGAAAMLQQAWRQITAIDCWAEYYAVGVPAPADLEAALRAAVEGSLKAGYHEPPLEGGRKRQGKWRQGVGQGGKGGSKGGGRFGRGRGAVRAGDGGHW